jgi:hypothetical protein
MKIQLKKVRKASKDLYCPIGSETSHRHYIKKGEDVYYVKEEDDWLRLPEWFMCKDCFDLLEGKEI